MPVNFPREIFGKIIFSAFKRRKNLVFCLVTITPILLPFVEWDVSFMLNAYILKVGKISRLSEVKKCFFEGVRYAHNSLQLVQSGQGLNTIRNYVHNYVKGSAAKLSQTDTPLPLNVFTKLSCICHLQGTSSIAVLQLLATEYFRLLISIYFRILSIWTSSQLTQQHPVEIDASLYPTAPVGVVVVVFKAQRPTAYMLKKSAWIPYHSAILTHETVGAVGV